MSAIVSPTVSPQTLVATLKESALALPITSDSLAIAQELLQSIHDLNAAIEKQRKADKERPLKECQEIDARAKTLTVELAAAEKHLKGSIGTYMLERDRQARAAEALALEQAHAGASEALTATLDTLQTNNAQIEEARSRGATGKVRVKYVPSIEQPELVPAAYRLSVVDVKKLEALGRACGLAGNPPEPIAGVVWQEVAEVGAVVSRGAKC